MKFEHPLTRRQVLRGLGTTIALPALESYLPRGFAADKPEAKPGKRLVFLSYPFGTTWETWIPTATGKNYALSPGLQPLARHRAGFSFVSNLTNGGTNPHFGCTNVLTCASIGGDQNIKNTISCDQEAARVLGQNTRFPSLELSGRAGESGWGPGGSLAWSLEGNPIAGESSPVALFDRLFGGGEVPLAERTRRIAQNQSVLDAVSADARALRPSLSGTDRERLDEYFQSVRDIESRLARSLEWVNRPNLIAPFERPSAGLKGTDEPKFA